MENEFNSEPNQINLNKFEFQKFWILDNFDLYRIQQFPQVYVDNACDNWQIYQALIKILVCSFHLTFGAE